MTQSLPYMDGDWFHDCVLGRTYQWGYNIDLDVEGWFEISVIPPEKYRTKQRQIDVPAMWKVENVYYSNQVVRESYGIRGIDNLKPGDKYI